MFLQCIEEKQNKTIIPHMSLPFNFHISALLLLYTEPYLQIKCMHMWMVCVCVCVCVFIAVVLMLPLTQNPSLGPAMRLQPAMGNADYCCYSIRQSACVHVHVHVCVCEREKEKERGKEKEKENGYYPRPGAKCFSVPSFRSRTIFSHAAAIPCHSRAVNQSVLQKSEITVCRNAMDWCLLRRFPSFFTPIRLVSPVLAL